MKALVKQEAAPGLWLTEVPEPKIGINDVLIEVLKTGICGTDLHIYVWDAWARKTVPVGLVVGHEFVGRVVAVGTNVNDFHPGDIVSGEGHVVCGRCRNCMAGRRHLCAHTQGVGVNRSGAFAELIALPMTNVWHHDPQLSREVQSIFDPLGNAVHSALSFPVLGEDVLITGAGPIGIMAAAVVRHAGARHVVITDVNPFRLELAQRMGVTRAVDVRQENLRDVQEALHMTEGFDIGLEMSGNANAFRDMLQQMCHGGRIAMLGIPSEEIAIDWNIVVFNMLTIKGIYGREMYETWYKMTVMLQSGLQIEPVITHRFHYTDYEARVRGHEVGGLRQSCPDVEGRRMMTRQHPVPANITETLHDIRERGLWKHERTITSPQRARIEVSSGRKALNMCANNYLGLADHPEVVTAAQQALAEWGFGLASVRFICGTQSIHRQLEQQLSEFLGMEDTILYSSCFDANGGLFETLLGPEDAVISDELNHASIIDGVRLCKAQRYRYKNNDPSDLEARLQEARAAGAREILITSDGVFSMDGYIARLDEICDVADKYRALVHFDDCHATGFLGPGGRGTHEYRGVMGRVDLTTGTLGKALGGGSGGYTSGRRELIDLLRQRSRPYLFSNSVAPPMVGGALKALQLAREQAEFREQLSRNTQFFRREMTAPRV